MIYLSPISVQSYALTPAFDGRFGTKMPQDMGRCVPSALSFAYRRGQAEIYFSSLLFLGMVKLSAIQHRAEKTCANQSFQSPSSHSQPSLAAWTMTQNVQSLAVSLVRFLLTKLVAALQLALLRVRLLAPCATTFASAAKPASSHADLGSVERSKRVTLQNCWGLSQMRKGFQAVWLGGLFLWAK
ncbi:hypothetical protein EDD53_1185 [Pacificibacter maritimus]|uniref:Uncharacterized protein n=1 Tax=Pacificibacter maritimus TaxID=762213 RepID=A0A3N4UN11_9RHOB|nr:hypothetical protein EDD53_1185 [Pacificibacter maritimus]